MRGVLLLSMVLLAPCGTHILAADRDADGVPDSVEEQLSLPASVPQRFTRACTSPNRGFDSAQSAVNAPDIVSLDLAHVGGRRLLLKIRFASRPSFVGAVFIAYLDMDNDPETGRVDRYHGGVDIMVSASGDTVRTTLFGPGFEGSVKLKGVVDHDLLWVAMDAPLGVDGGYIELGVHLLSQRGKGISDSTPHAVVTIPANPGVAVPAADFGVSSGLRPLSDYRYFDDSVKLERREDKGLSFDQVVPSAPIVFGRERPVVPFTGRGRKLTAGTAVATSVPVVLREEAGVGRSSAWVTFGFPLPKGALFDAASMRVAGTGVKPLWPQFTATAFWPDDSLKWVRTDLRMRLDAGATETVTVAFGTDAPPASPEAPLQVDESDDAITVVTGPLKAVVGKKRFTLLDRVWMDRTGNRRFDNDPPAFAMASHGMRLLDENRHEYSSSRLPPKSVAVEMAGPHTVILRVEGDYADGDGKRYMSYIARMAFRAGSSRVDVAWTHVNSYVQTEFTDITSLHFDARVLAGEGTGALHRRDADGRSVRLPSPARVFQLDDQRVSLHPAPPEGVPDAGSGVATWRGPTASMGLVIHDFRRRWPKALSLSGERLAVELLPVQPTPDYGRDMPHYLKYPFIEGRYRLKWGMSFTERLTFDFAGTMGPEELEAEADFPVVAVVPADWYATTAALGPLAAPRGKQFSLWDDYVETSFRGHLKRKAQYRETGFLNYGDWYGERGRNWGNNEYDLAHGLFMQFARTGQTAYYRVALAAARHQADVDVVHAYPDPAYVGANHLHSIGHTGAWTQTVKRATWSHKYGGHTDARNGHTWAEGMIDAWHLAGEPRVMEASLALGEHIAWAMSRDFSRLGTHERSAGWSLVAIMAIYRATYDPVYLEAAERIAAVALREQKLDEGGAWPHLLPRDHAGGHRGARGNNLFLIGVLLSGLADYHAETDDAKVRESIIAGTRWLVKSWDEVGAGWPYSAGPEGEPYYQSGTSLNTLVVGPVIYSAQLTGEGRFADIAEMALEAVCYGGASAFGKSLAQRMIFTSKALARLQTWSETHRPQKGKNLLAGGGFGRYIQRASDAVGLSVRGPNRKVFLVGLTRPTARLLAKRTPHGARPKDQITGVLTVRETGGDLVTRDEFSTDGAHEFGFALAGTPGSTTFRVVVDDDMRSVWDLSGEGARVLARTTPGFSIGRVGRGRFYFTVPDGTEVFRIRLTGVHTGAYGAAVLTSAGEIAALHEATNPGQVQLPWAPKVTSGKVVDRPETGVLEVRPGPGTTGGVWSVVLWAGGDIACELEGIPPFLATSKDACFLPVPSTR